MLSLLGLKGLNSDSQILGFLCVDFLLDPLSFHSECYKLSSLYFLQLHTIVK